MTDDREKDPRAPAPPEPAPRGAPAAPAPAKPRAKRLAKEGDQDKDSPLKGKKRKKERAGPPTGAGARKKVKRETATTKSKVARKRPVAAASAKHEDEASPAGARIAELEAVVSVAPDAAATDTDARPVPPSMDASANGDRDAAREAASETGEEAVPNERERGGAAARARDPGAGAAPGQPAAVTPEEILLEFEQRPLLEPPYPVAVPRPRAPGRPRRLAVVLHAHLPWVLGHGTWPHGEDWLAEAIVHCYLPLVDAFRRLAASGRRSFVTVSVTPILAAAFADRRTPALVDRYLAERTAAAAESRGRHPLATWWRDEFERLRGVWVGLDRDLVGALAGLAEGGAIELATSAGAHVYLPLAHTPKLVRLALRTGCETHRELFGLDPRGCWMPECAYRPGGPWTHPVTGASEESRPGNEEFLAEQGLHWTVVDGHLLRAGDPAFPYLSDLPPEEVAEPGGPHPKPYWIRRSSVAAFLRDARSAAQVWSRQGGYPGDGAFLDFHKRHWPSGLRLWRVTGEGVDLGDKLVYWPEDARRRAREQAEHFVGLVAGLAGMGGGVVCAPFDAELFGHWWFEGPIFLERVLELAAGDHVDATTPAREIDAGPSLQRAFFAEGSWGAGGDHRVWVNPRTEHFWRELAELERRAFAAVRWRGSRKWRRAILNQLLLAAASDWPFLVTMETGADYAEQRFREHAARLRELVELGPRARRLPAWVDGDLPFPEIEPEWALPPFD